MPSVPVLKSLGYREAEHVLWTRDAAQVVCKPAIPRERSGRARNSKGMICRAVALREISNLRLQG